jgi:outer membrane autotransporter protein
MNGIRTAQLSLPAIAAAFFLMPTHAEACSATSAIRNGVDVVDIVCNAGDPAVEPFATSYAGSTGDGADTFTMTGGSILVGAPGTTLVDGSSPLDPGVSVIDMGLGNDVVIISGGQIGTAADPIDIELDSGVGLSRDTFRMSGGTLSGSVFGLGGGNFYDVSGGTILGSIFAGSQDDTVTISGSVHIHGDFAIGTDSVGLEAGNDRFTMTGGTLDGSVSGGDGNDVMSISGGTINSFVVGNNGTDQVIVSGGTINGDIDAERVVLTGGTINGDVSGISHHTLIINDAASAVPLVLRNGIVFSGGDGVASITNSDLAAGGTRTQGFTGFTNVTLDNSTLGFATGAIGINALLLQNGSTLFVRGAVAMPASAVALLNSTVTLVNGAAGDVFFVGGLALTNSQLALDVDQRNVTADRIIAGALTGTGTNVVNINLIGAPLFTGQTTIPVITGPITGTFVAAGLPGTQATLFTYQALQNAAGLAVVITPGNIGPAAAVQDATDVSTIETALDALDGINKDALDYDMGLGNGNGGKLVQLSDTFGVFASGQFAHTEHDGFEISANGFTAPGPSFGANDFSAAISLDFNLAKTLDIEDKYGLNLGLFGGYASTDVTLDDFNGFTDTGEGTNHSGMFGGYGLFRKEFTYALVSATAFLGNTDIGNGVLGTTASYDTTGYAVTGSVGHIFMLGEKTRFDLRGGVIGVSFDGDDFGDSNGNQLGGSHISFGALKFEPGIYTDRQLDNGMTFSPYLRGELQQRFGYENTASISGLPINFDDADFSAALSTGFNLKMSKTATMSGEVRGKLSSDSATVGGKLGLKIAF